MDRQDMKNLSLSEIRQALLHSKKFLSWSPRTAGRKPTLGLSRDFTYRGKSYKNLGETYKNLGTSYKNLLGSEQITEKHYSPAQVATLWGISIEFARTLFRNEPGVLKMGSEGTRLRRGYKTLRIPQSVLERVHQRLSE